MSATLLVLVPAAFIAVGVVLAYLTVVLGRMRALGLSARAAEQPLAHQLPYWIFVQCGALGIAIHVDLAYSCMAELTGIDGDCLDDEALHQITLRLHDVLQNLPPGICLQFLHETDGDVQETIEQYRASAKVDRPGTPGPWLVNAKAEQLAESDGLRKSRLFLSMSLSAPKRFGAPSAAPVSKQLFDANHSGRINKLSSLFAEVKAGLFATGISTRPLDASELRREIYQLLNPNRKHIIPDPFSNVHSGRGLQCFSDPQTAREQLIFSGIHERERDLICDGKRIRVLTLKTLPGETHAALVEPLLVTLPFHCRVVFSVETLDSLAALDHLKQKRDQAHVLATLKEKRNQEAEAQEQDVLELIDKNLQSSLRMTRVSLSVVLSVDVSAPDAERELDQQTAEILRVTSGMQGAQMMVDELCQLPEFLATLPGNAARGQRRRKCTSQNAVSLIPIWQPYRGSQKPLVLIQNGRNNLVGLDPFDPSLDNPNAFMAGTTGSGKSATTNFLLLNALASGAKALIVDVGGSYRRVVDAFGGQYFAIGLEDDAPCRLNLFFPTAEIVKPDGTLDETRHQLMCAVVERMVCDATRPQLRNAERVVVSRAIVETYRRQGQVTPILSDLAGTLRDVNDPEDAAVAHELARDLRVWFEGPAARILNGHSTINLTADCAAFDLKGLEGQRDLQAVVMLILSGIIWNLVMRDRTERKMIVFDEVWKLLSTASSAAILEELYRTSRKYRAAILSISQSIEDFSSSSIASALMNNSATTYMLRHRRSHEAIAAQFRLNPREQHIFERLEMRRGEYTEALILHGEHHFLARIVLSPLEYWIATTDPNDIALERSVAARYPERSPIERLTILAKKFPSGAAKAGTPMRALALADTDPVHQMGGQS